MCVVYDNINMDIVYKSVEKTLHSKCNCSHIGGAMDIQKMSILGTGQQYASISGVT